MKTLKSILAAAAAAALAVCAAETASATPISIASFGSLDPGIYDFDLSLSPGDSANSYVVSFTTTQPLDALFAMQAQNSGPDPIQFELDEFNGSSWTLIAQSDDTPGAALPAHGGMMLLGAGVYQLVTDSIGVPVGDSGSLDGSIKLSAVPEPATWAMLILGLGLIGLVARRRPEGAAAAA